MVRVWFNHWFSTSHQLIQLMKQDTENKIYVIGSNRVSDSVIREVCDEWYEEPALDGEEYIDYCVEFCRKHELQVFVPRRRMVDISKNIERFRNTGVRVMADDYSRIAFLNDKAAAYDFFKGNEAINVPEYRVVNNLKDFLAAYEALHERYEQLCFKYVQDEGGMSFRRIVDSIDCFQALSSYPGNKIAYRDLIRMFEGHENFRDMMIMPYLPGDEISVDCLTTDRGLIAIPRQKSAARTERVFYDEGIIRMCRSILEKVPLEYPCNIQFKLYRDIPYLLEVNTRMSGGLQMGCLAAGVNIPNIALNKLLGRNISWTMDCKEKLVSYIEMPRIVG